MLKALALFLSLRAAIKAHVSAAGAESQSAAGRSAEMLAEGRRYLALALSCFERPGARLIAVGGLSGAGKSTFARTLAPALGARLGAVVVRSDVARKRLLGAAPETPLGEEAYSREISQRVYGVLGAYAAEALAAGLPVIVDAVFASPDERAAIEAVARRAGAAFHGFWLEAPREVMEERLEARTGDASDATVSVLAKQLGYDLGQLTWRRLPGHASPEALVGEARAARGL